MPRKPKTWPEPIEIFEVDDLIVEVFEEGKRYKGRGSSAKNKHDIWVSLIEEWATDLLLTPRGKKKSGPDLDMLDSASKFDRALQRSLLYPESGDSSSVRKRVYPRVKRHIEILEKLLPQRSSIRRYVTRPTFPL